MDIPGMHVSICSRARKQDAASRVQSLSLSLYREISSLRSIHSHFSLQVCSCRKTFSLKILLLIVLVCLLFLFAEKFVNTNLLFVPAAALLISFYQLHCSTKPVRTEGNV